MLRRGLSVEHEGRGKISLYVEYYSPCSTVVQCRNVKADGGKNVKQVTNIIFFLQVLTSERNDCVPRYEAIHPINYKMLLRVHSVQ